MAPLVLGLDGQKMSKVARTRSRSERTKTKPPSSSDAPKRIRNGRPPTSERAGPEISNLVLLTALCQGRSPEESFVPESAEERPGPDVIRMDPARRRENPVR
jgi:tryptophanyl-tRNA synthetase